MSFSSDVKKECYGIIGAARHCRIAELAALIEFCGTIESDKAADTPTDTSPSLCFRTTHKELLDKYLLLLKKTFRIGEEQVRVSEVPHKKTRRYEAFIRDGGTVEQILQAIDYSALHPRGMTDCYTSGAAENSAEVAAGSAENSVSTGNAQAGAIPYVHSVILNRNCCRRAFIRGAFLSAGSVSDPNRSYHFEIVCGSSAVAEGIAAVIRSLGIDARTVKRQKYFVVYVKESSQISDLLGLMDANVSLLNFENIRVVRDVRGGVNRKVNCETANIEKTASAAARQIEDIRYIEKTIGFSKLSKALDEMAEVRLQYPTATLAELGGLLDPPVSKSGVNHRLRALSRLADDLRNTRRQ